MLVRVVLAELDICGYCLVLCSECDGEDGVYKAIGISAYVWGSSSSTHAVCF